MNLKLLSCGNQIHGLFHYCVYKLMVPGTGAAPDVAWVLLDTIPDYFTGFSNIYWFTILAVNFINCIFSRAVLLSFNWQTLVLMVLEALWDKVMLCFLKHLAIFSDAPLSWTIKNLFFLFNFFISYMFLGCTLRIWSLFLAVCIGKSIHFADFFGTIKNTRKIKMY